MISRCIISVTHNTKKNFQTNPFTSSKEPHILELIVFFKAIINNVHAQNKAILLDFFLMTNDVND